MASVFLERRLGSSSADEPIEHEYQVDETKAKVKRGPNFASFHDQMKETLDDFEDLKNAVISSITLFENNIATLNAKEERLVNLSRKIPSINFESTIKLNIGGNIYQTSLETLTKYSESLLADMFSTRFDLKQGNDGCYFIDRDGTHFRHILKYLRSGKLPVLSVLKMDADEILEEAEYYGLVALVKAINNRLNGDDDTDSENVMEEDEIAINSVVDETRKELCATEEKLKSFLNLLEASLKVMDEAKNYQKEVSKKLSNIHFGENVKIDIGGTIFKTSLKTLRKEPESVLASMFSDKFDLKKEDDGSFFVDRDGTFFHHILDYLRDGKISEDVLEDYGSQMEKEAEFYGLLSLKEQIHNYNHVKLNVGGREFVFKREVLKQYPESIFGRMLSGRGCAFNKGEDGSFYVEHDGTNFHHILEFLRYGIISDDVIKECGVSLHGDAKFYMLPSLQQQVQNYYNVKVDIGGREFIISRKVLGRFPESLFGKMLAGKDGEYVKRTDGSYFIEYDGTNFHHIISYLRSGTLSDSVINKHSPSLHNDADFYLLPGLRDRINNYDKVKLSISGREFVVSRRVLNQYPDSLFGRMLAGEEGDYVRKDDGSYLIEHDASMFSHVLDYLKDKTIPDNVIEKYSGTSPLSPSLLADAEFYGLLGLVRRIHDYHNITVVIGNKEFVVSREMLCKFTDSLFGRMLAGKKGGYVKRIDGSYLIQYDCTNFHHILDYLRDGKISEDILEDYGSQMEKEAEFYGLSGLKELINKYNHVKLNVGGRDFEVTREVLKQCPESIFGRMLSGKACAFKKREDGSFYVEHDGTNFHHILEYLRYGIISDDVIKECGVSLHDDAKFYMLPSLEKQIENYHNVKVDVGGREFVISRKMLNNFADSMLGKMLAGEEGDYIKRSDGSYIVQHDGTNFEHILTFLRTRTLSEDVIHQHTESLLADAEFYMLPGLVDRINTYHKVKLTVNGREFVVSRRVLTQFPDSLFGRMLAGKDGDYVKRSYGSYCLQHVGTNFDHILDYLRSGTLSEDIIEQHAESLLADAAFYMLPGLKGQINYHTVKLSIDGREFVVSKRVLNRFPDSMFGKMLAGWTFDYVKGYDGSYIVQHDGRTFHHILTYLRSGTLSDDVIDQHAESLLNDADFYMLPGLKDRINNYDNVELSINGREFVVSKRILNKFPDSMFGEMLAGKKGNYVKRHDGSYFVERDGKNFHHILSYLSSGVLPSSEPYYVLKALLADAEFYMLPCFKDQVKKYF